jgi:hypothetical protein
MTKPTKPGSAAEGGSKSDDRRARQAAALRENLRKRKVQSRARTDAKPKDPTENGSP